MREPKDYFKARIKAMSKNHHFRYPKWNERDVEMMVKLLREDNCFKDNTLDFLKKT